MSEEKKFARVQAAIEAIRSGEFVILVDDEDRENEGDLVLAAQFATPEKINFMAKEGRGLICLSLSPEKCDKLQLPDMVPANQSKLGTAFTVSIGAKSGITTGISAQDRAFTVQTVLRDDCSRDDLVFPGHVFPLRAREGGVLVRGGHTEGSVDIARLAGLKPAGVICEILKDDGSMARRPDLEEFAKKHSIPMLSIEEMINYRLSHDPSLVSEFGEVRSLKRNGREWSLQQFKTTVDDRRHLALTLKNSDSRKTPLLRLQSSSSIDAFIDVLTSEEDSKWLRALNRIQEWGNGSLVFLNRPHEEEIPEGEKLESKSQEIRQIGLGTMIVKKLGYEKIQLLSSGPKKIVGLEAFGIELESFQEF